jgi:hypothetical protein
MSCAWGLKEKGKISLFRLFPSKKLEFIIGVKLLVAQVSITSSSAITSSLVYQSGKSFNGFIGVSFISHKIIFQVFFSYQTGIGTQKYLCLEIPQSHFKFVTHSSYLFFINDGCQFISSQIFNKSSLISRILINHCLTFNISIGVPHLS